MSFRMLCLASLASVASVQAQTLSPSGNYTPTFVTCPNTSLVRPASQGLSSGETAWLEKRRPNVISAIEAYLNMVGIPGFNTSSYIAALQANTSATPVLGLTLSGGGSVRRSILYIQPSHYRFSSKARRIMWLGNVSSA